MRPGFFVERRAAANLSAAAFGVPGQQIRPERDPDHSDPGRSGD
jgi:hypothetical protein